jgi:hypothetical protein
MCYTHMLIFCPPPPSVHTHTHTPSQPGNRLPAAPLPISRQCSPFAASWTPASLQIYIHKPKFKVCVWVCVCVEGGGLGGWVDGWVGVCVCHSPINTHHTHTPLPSLPPPPPSHTHHHHPSLPPPSHTHHNHSLPPTRPRSSRTRGTVK